MNFLVTYFNGRSNREKYFNTRKEAEGFMDSTDDKKATLWGKLND